MELIALLLLSPGDARAEEPLPEIAVVGLHDAAAADRAFTDGASARLAEALDATGRFDALTPAEFSTQLRGREELVLSDSALGAGRRDLDDGRALFERAAPEEAVPLLRRAVERLESGTRVVGDPRALIEAWLVLGLAQASLGESAEALGAWRQVVVLEPDRALDPVNYPPKFVSLFDEARAQVTGALAGALTVDTALEGEVLVDGRSVGSARPGAPLELSGLPAGTHYVTLRGDDGGFHVDAVALTAGASALVEVREGAWSLGRPAESDAERSSQIAALYGALGEYGGADFLLVGGVVDDALSLCLYAPRSRTFSKALSIEADGDAFGAAEDLLGTLAGYATASGGIRTDRTSIEPPPLDISSNAALTGLLFDPADPVAAQEDTGGRRWLLWGGVGALAVGGAVTAAVLLTGEDEAPSTPDEVDDGPSTTDPAPGGTVTVGPLP